MICFRNLTFKNFLSVGNTPVSIDLDKTKTTLVHGTNGSGKSTLLDALCYVLFGKSFRGVNLSQLVNTQNKKGLLVELDFKIGKDEFLVRRGMKPRLFETFKNGEIIENKAADKDSQAHLENNILKLNFRSFTQIVILGSSNFVPFMQLNATGRRECVEDFLDIKVFSTMAIIAKDRLRGLKEQLRISDADLEAHLFKLQVQQDKIRDIQSRDENQVKALEEKIREADAERFKLGLQIQQWEGDIDRHKEFLNEVELTQPKENIKKLETVVTRLNAKLSRLAKEKDFFTENSTCPTCTQPISYELAEIKSIELKEQMKEVDDASWQARRMQDPHVENDKKMCNLKIQLDRFERELFELETQYKSLTKVINDSQDEITKIATDTQSVDFEDGIYLQMEREVYELKNKKRELEEELKDNEVVVGLLKDSGIKTQIVKKYLPAMNKAIRYYMNELDFPIHFALDSEFNETVQSPLQQDFSYQSFSEGQKGRIDLSLMFTWREIARMKNSVSTNILFLDEVFSSSLDETGKDCLLQILRYRLPDNQRIIVVDHTLGDVFKDKFDRAIEVTRNGGFSRYD